MIATGRELVSVKRAGIAGPGTSAATAAGTDAGDDAGADAGDDAGAQALDQERQVPPAFLKNQT